MRATCLLTPLVLTATSVEAAPCRWQENRGWPALFLRDDIVHFERTWVCPADATGTLALELYVVSGGKKVEVESATSEVEPSGKWDQKKKVSLRGFPNGTHGFCSGPAPANKRRVGHVFDHEVRAARVVKLRAEVRGTGAMKSLAMKEEIEAYCRACERVGASFYLRRGRASASSLDHRVTYSMSVDKKGFACARRGSTLELRYFLGDDTEELTNAIRPAFVEKGLERKFKMIKDEAVLEGKPPMARLCSSGKSHVAVELGGLGELRHLDSSRRVLPLNCE